MPKSTSKITVQNTEIIFLNNEIGEYISLMDRKEKLDDLLRVVAFNKNLK